VGPGGGGCPDLDIWGASCLQHWHTSCRGSPREAIRDSVDGNVLCCTMLGSCKGPRHCLCDTSSILCLLGIWYPRGMRRGGCWGLLGMRRLHMAPCLHPQPGTTAWVILSFQSLSSIFITLNDMLCAAAPHLQALRPSCWAAAS
jgi:hypothetical protein